MVSVKDMRICVIGCGPAGMSFLNAFMNAQKKGSEIPQLVCFDKQNEMGGLWNYSWRTGVDEFGEQIHNSMYRYLWSNGPKECLEMADYTFDEHFKKPIASFPPRLVLRDYLFGKAKKYDIEKLVRTNHVVRDVEEDKDGIFSVSYENLKERKCSTETFDYVVVATGHYSVPHFPSYPGIETYPGMLLHSHDFRDAARYKDKKVVLVGSSYSAEDIALQLYKYGVKEIIISYRTAPMGFKWPEAIKEWPLLTKIEGSTVHFSHGKTYDADAIIFCTGYQHHFPFMPDSLRLHATNIEYPDHLYKGCIFNANPRVIYLAMQDQWYTFNMFDAEAYFSRDYILGKFQIPTRDERSQDIKKWRDRFLACSTAYDRLDFQHDYIADLFTFTNYPKYDHDGIVSMFKQWKVHKAENILTYREKCFTSPCTGTVGSSLYAPWVDAMDDSLERFIQ